MQLILFDLSWMLFNVGLAIIPIIFGILMVKTSSHLFKILFSIIWILFLPNTIYLVTDIMHLPEDAGMLLDTEIKLLLTVIYLILIILGVISYILAMYPFEELFFKKRKKKYIHMVLLLIVFNFIVGLGLVLGRVERINSWDVFTKPIFVLQHIIFILTSEKLLLLLIAFGALCNIVYFSLRETFLKK